MQCITWNNSDVALFLTDVDNSRDVSGLKVRRSVSDGKMPHILAKFEERKEAAASRDHRRVEKAARTARGTVPVTTVSNIVTCRVVSKGRIRLRRSCEGGWKPDDTSPRCVNNKLVVWRSRACDPVSCACVRSRKMNLMYGTRRICLHIQQLMHHINWRNM